MSRSSSWICRTITLPTPPLHHCDPSKDAITLIGLLSNTKLRGLRISNLNLLATRISNLPAKFNASWLQTFCFYGRINNEDRDRLMNIISHCSQLVDLRLVTGLYCAMGLSLQQAVFSLRMMRRLHVSGWNLRVDQGGNVNDPRPMKEIGYYTDQKDISVLSKIIRQLGPVLEVFVLYSYDGATAVDIGPENPSSIPLLGGRERSPAGPLSDVPHFSALTHLDLSVPLTRSSLQYLSTILPRLDLVHFRCNKYSHALLMNCNLASLRSLSIVDTDDIDLDLLLKTIGDGTADPA